MVPVQGGGYSSISSNLKIVYCKKYENKKYPICKKNN